jgi:hypothetical protein
MGGTAFGVVVGASLMVGVFAAWRVAVDEHWARPRTVEDWLALHASFLAVAGLVTLLLAGVVAGVVLGLRALVGL